jgi:hypothetical protein
MALIIGSTPGVWGNSVVTPAGIEYNTAAAAVGRVGGAAEDGEYERNLVQGLCAGAGPRALPPEDLLESFLAQARTLKVCVGSRSRSCDCKLVRFAA